MREVHIELNDVTFSGIIPAYSCLDALDYSKKIYADMERSFSIQVFNQVTNRQQLSLDKSP